MHLSLLSLWRLHFNFVSKQKVQTRRNDVWQLLGVFVGASASPQLSSSWRSSFPWCSPSLHEPSPLHRGHNSSNSVPTRSPTPTVSTKRKSNLIPLPLALPSFPPSRWAASSTAALPTLVSPRPPMEVRGLP